MWAILAAIIGQTSFLLCAPPAPLRISVAPAAPTAACDCVNCACDPCACDESMRTVAAAPRASYQKVQTGTSSVRVPIGYDRSGRVVYQVQTSPVYAWREVRAAGVERMPRAPSYAQPQWRCGPSGCYRVR